MTPPVSESSQTPPEPTAAASAPTPHPVERRGLLFVSGSMLGRGLTYLTSLLLTRFVTPETLGAFFFAMTLLQTLVLVALLGQDTLMLRAVPGLQAEGAQAVWWRIKAGLQVVVGLALLLTLGFEALWWELASGALPITQVHMVACMVAFLTFHAVHRLVSMATLAREEVLASMLVRQWLFPLLFPLFFAILLILREDTRFRRIWNLGPGWAYGLAALASALVGLLWLRRRVQNLSSRKLESDKHSIPQEMWPWTGLAREGLPVMGSALLGYGILWMDSLLVGLLCPLEEVGRYGLVVRVSMAGMLLLDAFNSALGPAVGRVKHDREASGRLYARAARLGLLLYLPLLLVATLAPQWLLTWFGPDYATPEAARALQYLVWGQAVNVATGGSGLMLILLGRAELAWRNSLLTFVGLILAWTAVSVSLKAGGSLSIETAALLSGSAIACLNLLRGVQLYRHFGIVPWRG